MDSCSDSEISVTAAAVPSATSILSAEIKELRNKIISVKKSVTKGDKKQKKAVQDELASLETLLISKQEELQKLKESAAVTSSENPEEENCDEFGDKKSNKARLKRERRKEEKAAEWEANRQAALAEIASRPDLALEESKAFAHRLAQRGFRILEVSADGHCMFSAIGCQLDPPKDHWELRKMAAGYLREHRDEYQNFIDFDNEISCSDDQNVDKFEIYCQKIESTGLWGGQIELDVLSRALNLTITVIQAEGPELNFNLDENGNNNNNVNDNNDNDENVADDSKKPRIYLSFHKFAFSLGEHYNALLLN